VEDHCKAIQLAFEKGKPGESYAVGAKNEQNNLALVYQICSLLDEIAPISEVPPLQKQGLNRYSELIHFVEDRPGHDQRYAVDSGKITRQLGWQAEVKFETGLRRTIEWYLSNPKWVDQASSDSYAEWIEQNYAARGRAQKEQK
jgi:dTDP-glucose 4,6-dehydratase